jgi:hypothetical protein
VVCGTDLLTHATDKQLKQLCGRCLADRDRARQYRTPSLPVLARGSKMPVSFLPFTVSVCALRGKVPPFPPPVLRQLTGLVIVAARWLDNHPGHDGHGAPWNNLT